MPIFVNNKAFRIVIWYPSGSGLINMMLKRIYIAVVLFAKQTDKQRKTGKPQCNICLPVNGGGCIKEEPLNFANIFLLPLSAKIEKVIFKALLKHGRIISERGKAKGCIFCCCHYQVCIF